MKLRAIRTLALAALSCASVGSATSLRAQAPPGPLPPSHPLPPPPPAPPAKKKPPVEPRKSLAGFWKLNMEESDDPRTKFEDARKRKASSGPGSDPNGGSGGPRVGVGYPPYPGGGPNGPYGGPGRGMGGNQDSDLSERLQDTVRPAYSQDILLKDNEVDSSNEHSDRVVFYTDGRKIQKSKDDTLQEVSARWNGPQLLSDERGPHNTKMSRSLELSTDGRQLIETWQIENGRSASPIVIRYVYDAASQYGP